ncbi:MAG: SulP family inorganic anion transporter [Candidatus Electryonea clarkiae]|nr:SulP family inorganic anion transporter [Candidatus Electryonea clarkiae]MDP8285598.1 SulP family inorganic anion transporter [Candidatus Electryonea clarkiae]
MKKPNGNSLSLMIRIFPFLRWFENYSKSNFRADFISGLTVSLVLIPQSMAYAQLADLPAYFGLYAAFLPPLVAAMFGSSHQLATGPVAMVSLMTSTALAPLATAGSEAFVAYAIILALIVGLFQLSLGLFRLGMVINFLSHPVVNGFTNAAAIIIATSQLSKLFGIDVDKAKHHYETVIDIIATAMHNTHLPTLALAALAFAIMIVLKKVNPRIPNVLAAVVITTIISWSTGFQKDQISDISHLHEPGLAEKIANYNNTLDQIDSIMQELVSLSTEKRETIKNHGKHSLEAIDILAHTAQLEVRVDRLKHHIREIRHELRDYRLYSVASANNIIDYYPINGLPSNLERESGRKWHLKVKNGKLDTAQLLMIGGGSVVGTIPQGLPKFSVPKVNFSIILDLLTMAIIISLIGFMEAISIAKAMAARTGQRLDPNRELIGQGLANIVGSFAQSYPVSGSFSRSAVNIQAGAVTGLSSAFSSLFVLLTLLFFTPLLFHLPQSVLAAIIMMAVIGLINIGGFIHAWKAQKYDGAIAIISFVCTLAFAPHLEKGIMIGVLLSLGLYLLRTMKPKMAILSRTVDGHYRNADRLGLDKCMHVAAIRFNDSLFFTNVNYLEDEVLEEVASMPELRHVLIVGNGINELDSSGEVLLSQLVSRLRESDIDISFSGLNDHIFDVMKRTHLFEKIGSDHFYHGITDAVREIHKGVCLNSPEHICPLLQAKFKKFEVSDEMVEAMKHAESKSH